MMLQHMVTPVAEIISVFSSTFSASPGAFEGAVNWSTKEYVAAHREVRASGKHNFEMCRIPIPTSIRYDRIREALGDNISTKEHQVLELLKYGMPIDCQSNYGVKKMQKNHQSAIRFKSAIT